MKCEKCGFDKDRIKILKMELEELNKKVKEAEKEYETSKKLMELTKEMDTSSDKNTEIYRNLMKEHLAKQLDTLQLRIDMIQKISPESAKTLQRILNDYEQAYHTFFKITDDGVENKSGWELLAAFFSFMTTMAGLHDKIDDIVKVCSYSIRDTLNRLES